MIDIWVHSNEATGGSQFDSCGVFRQYLHGIMKKMVATNFNTKNDTYRKLMGNGLTYRIPRFQRDYSWSENEWEDLWTDILGTIVPGGEPAHYMGYLVLQSNDDKTFDVIDGQQRLTTLSIIVLATLKNIQRLITENREALDNHQRLEQIRGTYIGYLDPVTLIPRSKLSLNRNNDHYYQTYIIPLEPLPQRGFRASEHGLRKAFEWFDKQIRDYVQQSKAQEGNEGKLLAQLVDTMSDKLFFTIINVTDELNAYKVFETLNARGVRLSATDLLKNYLFSVLHRENQHEHEIRGLESRWESMVGRLGSAGFPDFLRAHWNSRRSFVRQTDLFKTIRGQISGREAVFQLVREMEEDIETYLGLTQPENSGWSRELQNYASDLKLFNVRQPYPLLLSAKRHFSPEEFETIIRSCVVISFRYNVIGSQPSSEQERVYNQVASKITKQFGLLRTLQAMTSIYPSDDSFKRAFSEKIIRTIQPRNKKVVRYILCQIERHLALTDLDFNSDTLSIEHVLPQNPECGWEAFPEEETESYVYRLGNMTLLHDSQNRNLSNLSYPEKRQYLCQSNFEITRKLAQESAEWNPERLASHQNWMANQATSIWRISQLS